MEQHQILTDLHAATDELLELMEEVEGTPAELTSAYLAAAAYSAFAYITLTAAEVATMSERDKILLPKLLGSMRFVHEGLRRKL